MITLLLVDEPLLRHGLRMWLDRAADITVIGEASNEAEAVAQAQALHPDVVLMDIPMLAADGIAAAAVLRAHRFRIARSCSSASMMMRPLEHVRG